MDQSVSQTIRERSQVLAQCRALFEAKLHDYGTAWRIMRASSLTDQIFIKAERIRTIQISGESRVRDSIESEFVGIVNYGIIAVLQLELGAVSTPDMDMATALRHYDEIAQRASELMDAKNHDYGEAWRQMRVSSIVDLILSKVYRTKQLEDLTEGPKVSEGIDANYLDMVNYAIFGLIKLSNP